MIKPLEHVSSIKPYVPGKPVKELERELGITNSIKLASNENPLGPSQKALKALRGYIQAEYDLHRYPDGSGYYLKNAIVEKLNSLLVTRYSLPKDELLMQQENIILGNGSNELIDIAVRTFMGYGDEAVMAAPSFVVYSMAVKSVGSIAIEIPLIDYRHDLLKMADALTKKTKVVFIANPNNPTGTINKKGEFDEFMKRVPDGVLVVIDEAYYEYVMNAEYPDTMKYFREGKDILILRTFSKAYGLAGLRIGYGISKKEIIIEMNKVREPFNTNAVAQLAALHALEDDEHLKKTVESNENGKQFLYRELDSLGFKYVPTEANFIYICLEDSNSSLSLYKALLEMGVIVRPVGQREIRVTIGLPEENKRFIEAMKRVKE